MTVQWLGQAGILFRTADRTIMVDPYLSDSVEKINPANYRRVPVAQELFQIKPDILIFTHNHLDHYDPETVTHFLNSTDHITVLAPASVWVEVRKFGGSHNYVQFNAGTEWSEPGVHFRAVPATHSDPYAIGVVMEAEGRRYYHTGDTLYDSHVIQAIGQEIDVVFLPINGVGNNMNPMDAARFVRAIGARKAVPIHFGLFDAIDPADFDCENKVIPQIYQQIPL